MSKIRVAFKGAACQVKKVSVFLAIMGGMTGGAALLGAPLLLPAGVVGGLFALACVDGARAALHPKKTPQAPQP